MFDMHEQDTVFKKNQFETGFYCQIFVNVAKMEEKL